jgi:hypothetical protein
MKLEVKRPTYAELLQLAEDVGRPGMGAEYWEHCRIAAAVRSIDGTPIMFPQADGHVERIIGKLGDKGVVKVGKALNEAPAPDADQVNDVTVLPIDGVERVRLARICGSLADIRPWWITVYTACCVRAVNGTPVTFPTTLKEVRGLVKSLGDTALDKANDDLKAVPDDLPEDEEDIEVVIKN